MRKTFSASNERQLAGRLVLLPQSGECAVEQRQRPAALEDPLGRPVVGRLALVARFAVVEVERQRSLAAAALLSRGPVVLFADEAGDRRQQERAKPAALGIGVGQIALFQQRGEKLLRQIAGVFRASGRGGE